MAGWVLFYYKVDSSPLPLATLTSLISKASAFPSVGHKVIALHHKSIINVSLQLRQLTALNHQHREDARKASAVKAYQLETACDGQATLMYLHAPQKAPLLCLAAVGRGTGERKGCHVRRQPIYVRGLSRALYQVQV